MSAKKRKNKCPPKGMSAKNVRYKICPQKTQKEMHAIRYGEDFVFLRTFFTADLTFVFFSDISCCGHLILRFCGHILWRIFFFRGHSFWRTFLFADINIIIIIILWQRFLFADIGLYYLVAVICVPSGHNWH